MNSRANPTICKTFVLVLMWHTLLFLTGCWDRHEINDVAIVLSTGIDYYNENEIELSVEIVIPETMTAAIKEGGGGPGSRTSFVESVTGETMAEARSKLQQKIARNLFWGHGSATVIGEELAEKGIREHMDFFSRLPEARLRNNVFVSEGTAKDLISSLPHLENSSSETLTELAQFQIGMDITMSELLQMLAGETGGAALPMVTSISSKKDEGKMKDKTQLMLSGTAVFKGDKMVGSLDGSVTRGLLWVRDEIKSATITVDVEEGEGKVTGEMIRSYTKLIPRIENETWKITINSKVEDDVIQNASTLDLRDPESMRMLERKIEEKIEGRIKEAVEEVQQEMNVDIFNFHRSFQRKYTKEWQTAKVNWDEIFPNVEIEYDIDVKILRPGLSTDPPAVPKSEVEDI